MDDKQDTPSGGRRDGTVARFALPKLAPGGELVGVEQRRFHVIGCDVVLDNVGQVAGVPVEQGEEHDAVFQPGAPGARSPCGGECVKTEVTPPLVYTT